MFDFIEDLADAAVDVAGDVVGGVVDVADDYVFDTVDYVTGGVVDVDFDDGAFSVGVGFDGLAGLSASVGEHGISADGSLPGAELGLALGADGFGVDGSAGIDFGPLPYVEGHLEVAADGDVTVNGHVQGTIPTPVGLLSGSATAGLAVTEEGWGASIDADGTLRLPSGTTISGGLEAAHTETAAGSHTTLAVEGAVAAPGLGSIGGAVAYERVEEGGDVVEAFHAEVAAQGFGMSAGAEADHLSVTVDGVEQSTWSGSAQLDLPGDDLDLSTDTVGDGAGAAGSTGAAAPGVEPSGANEPGLDPFAATVADDALAGFDDPGAPPPADPVPDPFETGDPFEDVAAPAEPVSEFAGAIETADQVEGSMDDLFDEI